MKRLIPDTIAARTLLVLIIGLTISHVLSIGLYFTDRTSALLFTGGEHIGERIVTISRLAENATQAERQRIVQLADGSRLHVTLSPQSPIDDQQGGGWEGRVLRDALKAHLDEGGIRAFRFQYVDRAKSGSETRAPHSVSRSELSDETWLNFVAPVEPPSPFWSLRFALSIGGHAAAVGLLSALVVRYLTKPLAAFARAAHRLGVDVKAPPLPESGPAEVRQAIQAFNQMQERLRRFVDDRTQMIAAISHDLGTPITRLRLRAEFVEDAEEQKKMLADLDDMEKMVSSALSLARDEASCEPYAMVDLRTLLQRVCEGKADEGHDVTLDVGDDPVAFNCRPAALRRALANLIDNAIKYGGHARVSIKNDRQKVVLRIDDNGPGIPEDLREEVFKPFRRLEVSRSRETGGTGLGLTVARTIVRSHGGEISLTNREEGGLRIDVILPR